MLFTFVVLFWLLVVPLALTAAYCVLWWLAVILIAATRTLRNYTVPRKKPQHPSRELQPAM